ncbi:MAG: 23S rRNA (guanine(2445)-N(2))/(guanine(2069)-N(7))-methyltransferase, partial [bacterium]|nr:23S rRNA (guanine(2445)-N(2))/(guanine(2069)-N(7))-methyltransferase [bacterium]
MSTTRKKPRFFATASRGTEEVLAEELRALGVEDVDARPGGVAFGRRLEDAYRACLWSRVASRVLYPLARFEAGNAEALYRGVQAIDWTAHLGPEKTLAVDVAGGRSPAGPPHFLAL